MAEIPQIITEFIGRYIDSLHALEILLLLQDKPQKEWGPLAISRVLRMERSAVAIQLERFKSSGLVQDRKIGEEVVYRYAPSSSETAGAISELGKLYSTHSVRIIGTIYSKPSNNTRTYLDDARRDDEESA